MLDSSSPPELLEMARRIMRLGRALHADLDEPLQARLGLGIKELLVLIHVAEGETSPGTIAARQHLPAATVTRLITRLQEQGFLVRESDPSDLRRFRLSLTKRGETAVQQRRAASVDILAARLGHLPPSVVHDAVVALRALEAHLQPEGVRV